MMRLVLDVEGVVEKVARLLKIDAPTFGGWVRGRRGWARHSTGEFVLPERLLNDGASGDYVLYYIIHEVTHFATVGEGHNANFKKAERKVLRHFGLFPKYGKAYPKALLDTAGQVVWQKPNLRTI